MKTATWLALALAAGSCVGALAATEQTVTQKGKVFSQAEIAIKKGDVVVFFNDDNVAHNIMSTSPGNEFNLGSQMPGATTPVTFNAAGDVIVICAIHPRMRLSVKVN